jgi:hypothetical protein
VTPILSILVASLKCRADKLDLLLSRFGPQLTDDIELLTDVDDGEATIGAKRQRLLERSTGRWVCFHDDDDEPAGDYVEAITRALQHGPDCVGFRVDRFINGQHNCEAIHSLRFTRYGASNNPYTLHRTPNHLNPIRRELALQTGFRAWNTGEDTDYAVRVRPLLKTERFIDKVLYTYRLVRDKTGEKRNEQTERK